MTRNPCWMALALLWTLDSFAGGAPIHLAPPAPVAAASAARAAPRFLGLPVKLTLPTLPKLRTELNDFMAKLRSYVELANRVLTILPEYPKKRDELRAMRARPSPMDTGYRPEYFRTAAGRAELEQKAEVYDAVARKHLQDSILIERAFIDRQSRAVTSFADGLGDAAVVTGRYLAAVAFRYGTTGKAVDLQRLLEVLKGAYNLMTLAGAPNGTIVHVKTGQVVAPRPGLPVRGFGATDDPRVNTMMDLNGDNVYEYTGTLLGLPRKVYRFNSDISRDQTDGLFLGLGAAHQVLKARNAAPEWQAQIGKLVRTTLQYLISNGWKYIDLNGKPTTYGDQSSFSDPTVLIANLAWLGAAVAITNDAALRAEYVRITNTWFGTNRLFKAGLYTAVLNLVRPLIGQHDELLLSTVSMFNFNLLAMTIDPLIRFAPDQKLRDVFIDFLEQLVWPLWSGRRVPLFDFIHMQWSQKREPALVERTLGVLGQFRTDPFPFGNPASPTDTFTDFSGRTELRDPLFYYLREQWDRQLAPLLPQVKDNPFYAGGSAWPLGPGLVFLGDNLSTSNPYFLKGVNSGYWWNGPLNPLEPLVETAPHDFLLSYWYGRFHGLLQAGTTIALDPLKATARTVFGRVVQRLAGFLSTTWDRVKEFVGDGVMRLLPPNLKIQKLVQPMAVKLGDNVRSDVLSAAQQFWAELGPSLASLPVDARHEVVDSAWSALRQNIVVHLATVRAGGINKFDGWFNSNNRPGAIAAFAALFDPRANGALGQVDASYTGAMQNQQK